MHVIVGIAAVFAIFGVSVEAARETEVPLGLNAAIAVREGKTLGEPAAPVLSPEEIVDLVETVEDRDARINRLEGQLASFRQSQIEDQREADAAELEAENLVRAAALAVDGQITPEQNEAAMEMWRAGYKLGGGENLSAFENTILPCESGTQPNPDVAVGRTDDWGRAQINRPTWKARFESLTDSEFESGIVDPTLNGFMAAHVELEQGLDAWTCWRKR